MRIPETETREEWETTPVTLLEKEAQSVLNRITNVGKTLVVFSLRTSSSCCDTNSVRKHIDVFTKSGNILISEAQSPFGDRPRKTRSPDLA